MTTRKRNSIEKGKVSENLNNGEKNIKSDFRVPKTSGRVKIRRRI